MSKNKPGNGAPLKPPANAPEKPPSGPDPEAAEIDPVAQTIKPAATIDVELKGGPLTHQISLKVDGQEPKHVTKAVIVADVRDAVRLQTEQIKLIASVSVKVAGWEKKVYAHAAVRTDQEENAINYIGEGKTTRAALLDLLEKIPAEALDQ